MDFKEQIKESIENLSETQQIRILKYINSINPKKDCRGVDMLKFVGTISKSDLQIMQSIINDDCEVFEKNNF